MSEPTTGEWELKRTETDESLLYARDEKFLHCIKPIARVNHPDGSAEGIANALILREAKNLLTALKAQAVETAKANGWDTNAAEAKWEEYLCEEAREVLNALDSEGGN